MPDSLRCSHCKHLWRFHTQPDTNGPISCSKCVMREDKGPMFIPKGATYGPNFFHSTDPRMKNCSCFVKHQPETCEAVIYHGPGHQSHTHCRLKSRGHLIHQADYGEGLAEWYRKGKTFSGYFDEPPSVE